jgi:ubiquinone/menaquinone biosynthesis C-methylase UbiE
MTEAAKISYRCPQCREGSLAPVGDGMLCARCRKSYPVVEGIVLFSPPDAFYEGRFAATHGRTLERRAVPSPIKKLLQNLHEALSRNYLQRRIRFLKRFLSPGSTILDLGCGGGYKHLSEHGYVVGLDLSRTSLQSASLIYDQTAASDIMSLPFDDHTFDTVCLVEVLEHIPLDDKERLLREAYRVTCPGGRLLATFQTQGWLHRWARQYPEYYQKRFVDFWGHVGLETPTEALKRLEAAGYTAKYVKKLNSIIWPATLLNEISDNEFKEQIPILKLPAAYTRFIRRKFLLSEVSDFSLGLLSDAIEVALPLDWGCALFVMAERV